MYIVKYVRIYWKLELMKLLFSSDEFLGNHSESYRVLAILFAVAHAAYSTGLCVLLLRVVFTDLQQPRRWLESVHI